MATGTGPRQRGFNAGMLRLPLLALGVFGVLAGLAMWLVEGEFTIPTRVLLAAGILLIGIYVALEPGDIWGWMRGRSGLYTGNLVVVAVAALVILGLLNVMGTRYPWKWDLTATKQFSLGQQGQQVAAALPEPVTATWYFEGGDSRKQDLDLLMADYVRYSGGKLTYSAVDVRERPSEAIAAGVRQAGTMILQMGDKKQNITGTQEQDITTALIKLTRPEKKLYFLTGHGEKSMDASGQQDYSSAKAALERDNFTIAPLNLAATRAVPDDAAALVIAGPARPFLAEENDALRAYLGNGGKVMLFTDPRSEANPGLNEILQTWEVQATGNVVIDPARGLGGDPRVPLVDQYASHTATNQVRGTTVYPFATDFTYPKSPASGTTVTALAQSSDRSWGETNQQSIQQDANDPTGPLALVVAIQQTIAAGSETPPAADAAQQPKRTTRLFLVGTSLFMSNQFQSVAPYNADLFLNAANWLAEQDDLIAPRKDDTQRRVTLTGQQQNLVFFTSALFLPLAILAAGAAMWWTRR